MKNFQPRHLTPLIRACWYPPTCDVVLKPRMWRSSPRTVFWIRWLLSLLKTVVLDDFWNCRAWFFSSKFLNMLLTLLWSFGWATWSDIPYVNRCTDLEAPKMSEVLDLPNAPWQSMGTSSSRKFTGEMVQPEDGPIRKLDFNGLLPCHLCTSSIFANLWVHRTKKKLSTQLSHNKCGNQKMSQNDSGVQHLFTKPFEVKLPCETCL